jgi:hypothetical protein
LKLPKKLLKLKEIIVFCEVMKAQHLNPEFGYTWGEIQKRKITKRYKNQ